MEESLIIEIWDTFKEYVPEKNRDTAANHYLDFLTGRDVEMSVLEGLMGYDPHLDSAIELVVGENEDLEEDEEDYQDEDEEY
jgi:hypothetical protein